MGEDIKRQTSILNEELRSIFEWGREGVWGKEGKLKGEDNFCKSIEDDMTWGEGNKSWVMYM